MTGPRTFISCGWIYRTDPKDVRAEDILRSNLIHEIMTLSSGTVAHLIGSPRYADITAAIDRTIRYIVNHEGAIPTDDHPSLSALSDLIQIAQATPETTATKEV